jgi:Phosphate-selective porin O and P
VLSEPLDLYVDKSSGQVFVLPGPHRTYLGRFQRLPEDSGGYPSKEEKEDEQRQVEVTPNTHALEQENLVTAAQPSQTLAKKPWYERFSIKGYVQLRENFLFDKEGGDWLHPGDRSVGEDETFFLRRGRIALSGEPTEDLFLYLQPDLSSKPGPGDFAIQLRDLYADYYFTKTRDWRLRFGQTIIPYGFVNLQSSSRRAPLERPEALNSGAEGERDNGFFVYYSPSESRERFELLTKHGFKGAGDYGVVGGGLYTGQGLNRSDRNGEVHSVLRVDYPFQLALDTFLEVVASAYYGRFVPGVEPYAWGASTVSPTLPEDGIIDSRGSLAVILHPAPVGFEVEWNAGRGPELDTIQGAVRERSLAGGYMLINYRLESGCGDFLPFLRYQTYEGGRKFAANAPLVKVIEWDLGTEWSPTENLEFTFQYSYTPRRTDSKEFPYKDLVEGHRLGVQVQVVY